MTHYGLTPEGRETAKGVIMSLCHGYSLEQAATLNNLESADEIKMVLYLIAAEAGIVPRIHEEDMMDDDQ